VRECLRSATGEGGNTWSSRKTRLTIGIKSGSTSLRRSVGRTTSGMGLMSSTDCREGFTTRNEAADVDVVGDLDILVETIDPNVFF